jgi:hypothetical protein
VPCRQLAVAAARHSGGCGAAPGLTADPAAALRRAAALAAQVLLPSALDDIPATDLLDAIAALGGRYGAGGPGAAPAPSPSRAAVASVKAVPAPR